jgi:hypothetical protein
MSETASVEGQPLFYRFQPDTQIVRRSRTLLLVSHETGVSVRVSPVAEDLLPLLTSGAHFTSLTARLTERHPTARDIEAKLRAFLDSLMKSGLIVAAGVAERHRSGSPRIHLLRPDSAMQLLARVVKRVPNAVGWTLLTAATLVAGEGMVELAACGSTPDPRDLIDSFSIAGLLFFFLVVIPLHEAGHALACRLAGAEVGSAGILLLGRLVPCFFVDTTRAYLVRERWHRFWIPAAGPLVNFLAAGAAAWALAVSGLHAGTLFDFLSTIFLLSALSVVMDTNPVMPSDGSRMLEAVLDDELARLYANFRVSAATPAQRRTVILYRWVCLLHVLATVLLLGLWMS